MSRLFFLPLFSCATEKGSTGKGRIDYGNGNWYEGELKNGMRHGYGKIVWNGDIYEGEFKNDLRHGKGTLVYPNGDSYSGEFKNGKRDGKGIVTYKDGGKITGTFKENRYHGLISCQYPNNKVFTGFYVYGKLLNQGIYTWSNHKQKISFWLQEEKEKYNIINEVESLLLSSGFTKLEKLAFDYRKTKSMFSDGNWKLKFFYDGIASNQRIFRDEDWKSRLQILKKWCGTQPESITAHVALAHCYVRYAWFARGSGWTTSVSDDHKKLFNERLKQAEAILNQAERLEDTCPFYWSVYQTTALGLSFDRARYEKIFSKAIAVEPSNYIYFFQKAKYLLNRWYGKDGEWERFALTVSDSAGGEKGDILYAQIVWYIMTYYNLRDHNTRINWDRVQRGFDLIHNKKPPEPNQGHKDISIVYNLLNYKRFIVEPTLLSLCNKC